MKLINKINFSLRLFDDVINKTTDSGMTAQMRTYYDKEILRNAKPKMIFMQFGQKKSIPANNGKTIQFRRPLPLKKATTPLTEGVTPAGHAIEWTSFTANVNQYGDYVRVTDVVDLTAVDNNLLIYNGELGTQAGATLDSLCRDELATGTNVFYGDGSVNARHLLVGGDATLANNDYFNTDAVFKAANVVKKNGADTIDGSYVCMAHMDQIMDLQMNDKRWNDVVKYNAGQAGAGSIIRGDAGIIGNVRFVESAQGKVFHAAPLSKDARNLSVSTAIAAGSESATISVNETLTSADQAALVGRKVLIAGAKYTIASATASSITIDKAIAVVKDAAIYPGEAGAAGRDVYAAFVVGKNAYGVIDVENGGLKFIVKPLGAGEDPLNQRATVGWKAMAANKILSNNFLVRIETTSSVHDDDYVDEFYKDAI